MSSDPAEAYNFHGEGTGEDAYDTYVDKGETSPVESATIVRGQPIVLQRFHDAALALPEPGAYPDTEAGTDLEGYLRRHFPDAISHAAFQRFKQQKIITKVQPTIVNGSKHQQYRIDPKAYEWVQRNLDPGPWPRCPHSGIKNLGGGEYACTNEACDEVYERADHAEVDG